MRIFLAGKLCVSVEEIDFLNPNRVQEGRERGVRVELRTAEADIRPGSIYASRGFDVSRGICRFDLLESAPRAQDRMHWHPVMPNGEGRKRLFDDELSADPLEWLGRQLRDAVALLEVGGIEKPARFAADARLLAQQVAAIVADAGAGLERTRQPWPPVHERDERGMALAG